MKLSLVRFALGAMSVMAPATFGQPPIQPPPPGQLLQARFEVIPYSDGSVSSALTASLAGTTIPLATFSINATKDGHAYTNTIVGTHPATSATTTTIDAVLVPLIIKIPSGSGYVTFHAWDGTCNEEDEGTLSSAVRSPIFVPYQLNMNGQVDTTQYVDAFRRAEFATVGGLNPNYHTLLNLRVVDPITITIPAGYGAVFTRSYCPSQMGIVSMSLLDFYLRNIMVNPFASVLGIQPTNFPIFLTRNVVFADGNGNCCILGYHSAFNPGAAVQTYAVAEYDSTENFVTQGINDVATLSHEVAEWMDDPLVSNQTPRWGNIGQEGVCPASTSGGSLLWESGDPLSGTPFTTLTDLWLGVHYHPQELAFFSWFYNAKTTPSLGTGGKFSNNGAFSGPSQPCPPGGTY